MSALDIQVGGDHYKGMKIQPMEYSMANGLDACQHTAIKYITRFRQKGGIADLEKAKHTIDMLIEFELLNAPVEPASGINDSRPDIVASSHGDGEHYAELSIWREWSGEPIVPVQGETLVEYMCRSGHIGARRAGELRWHHTSPCEINRHPHDIVKYRVIG